MRRVSPYEFCGLPVPNCRDYFVDFGLPTGNGNKIIYGDLNTVILCAERDPLFGINTRILSNTCGSRSGGVCVAAVKDGILRPLEKEDR